MTMTITLSNLLTELGTTASITRQKQFPHCSVRTMTVFYVFSEPCSNVKKRSRGSKNHYLENTNVEKHVIFIDFVYLNYKR